MAKDVCLGFAHYTARPQEWITWTGRTGAEMKVMRIKPRMNSANAFDLATNNLYSLDATSCEGAVHVDDLIQYLLQDDYRGISIKSPKSGKICLNWAEKQKQSNLLSKMLNKATGGVDSALDLAQEALMSLVGKASSRLASKKKPIFLTVTAEPTETTRVVVNSPLISFEQAAGVLSVGHAEAGNGDAVQLG